MADITRSVEYYSNEKHGLHYCIIKTIDVLKANLLSASTLPLSPSPDPSPPLPGIKKYKQAL